MTPRPCRQVRGLRVHSSWGGGVTAERAGRGWVPVGVAGLEGLRPWGVGACWAHFTVAALRGRGEPWCPSWLWDQQLSVPWELVRGANGSPRFLETAHMQGVEPEGCAALGSGCVPGKELTSEAGRTAARGGDAVGCVASAAQSLGCATSGRGRGRPSAGVAAWWLGGRSARQRQRLGHRQHAGGTGSQGWSGAHGRGGGEKGVATRLQDLA